MTSEPQKGQTDPSTPPRRPMVQLKDGRWVRRPLRVGERLSDEERDEITENIRRQAKAAAERFRATDPRRHGIRLPPAATAKSEEDRRAEARVKAEESKARFDRGEVGRLVCAICAESAVRCRCADGPRYDHGVLRP